jgi:pilus assembly protein Flp/PilA
MTKFFQRFLKDESGATAIEYGLIAAGISVAIITVVLVKGIQESASFNAVMGGEASVMVSNGLGGIKPPAASG